MASELGTNYPKMVALSENSRSAAELENTKISLDFSNRRINNKFGTAINFTN
jgi:hypothetical protein